MGDQIQKTYQADGPGKLTLKLERSDISIDTHDEPYLHVAISRIGDGGDTLEDDVIVTESQTDNDISLVMRLKEETKRRLENMMTPWRFSCRIRLPANYQIDLNTSGGNISVPDLEGPVTCITAGGNIKTGAIAKSVSVRTSGGNLVVAEGGAAVSAKTSGGNIDIGDAEGTVSATTSGGNISVGRANQSVLAHTSGGNIHLQGVGGTTEAISSGGNVHAQISRQPADHCTLETSGGSITARIAEGLSFDVDARAHGGQISCEFDLETSDKRDSLRGGLGQGGPALRLRTSGGDIRIYRGSETGKNDE